MLNFDEKAKEWDDNPIRVELANSIAKTITEQIPLNKQMRAMEFGCGTGMISRFLCDRVENITAVDNSSGMIAELKSKLAAERIKNITPVLADLTNGDDISGRFDIIFSNMVFHHLPEPEAIIQKLATMLSQDGTIIISDLDSENGGFHKGVKVPHKGFDRNEFKTLLKRAGLSELADTTPYIFAPTPERGNKEYSLFMITGKKN